MVSNLTNYGAPPWNPSPMPWPGRWGQSTPARAAPRTVALARASAWGRRPSLGRSKATEKSGESGDSTVIQRWFNRDLMEIWWDWIGFCFGLMVIWWDWLGFSFDLIGFDGDLMGFHGDLMDLMVMNWNLMGFNEAWWNSGFHGICWIVDDQIVFDGGSIHNHGILGAYYGLMEGLLKAYWRLLPMWGPK